VLLTLIGSQKTQILSEVIIIKENIHLSCYVWSQENGKMGRIEVLLQNCDVSLSRMGQFLNVFILSFHFLMCKMEVTVPRSWY
jgi:hypothetical protein